MIVPAQNDCRRLLPMSRQTSRPVSVPKRPVEQQLAKMNLSTFSGAYSSTFSLVAVPC